MTNEDYTYPMPNVGCLVGIAYQVLTSRLAAALADAGLNISVPEYLILRTLYIKDGLQQCEIADMLSKDKGAISRNVAEMSKKGIVRTEPVSYKCRRVYLSPEGRKIESTIMAVAKERHEALVSSLSKDDLNSFVKVLKTIVNDRQ